MTSGTSRNRFGDWGTLVLIAGMIVLVWINHALLSHQSELWIVWSDADNAIPSDEALMRWDAARLTVGGVLIPVAGMLLLWAGIRARPLDHWGVRTITVFIAGLGCLAFHLQWIYKWGSESYLELPRALVRTITILSLNAPLYLTVIGTVVLLRRLWLFRRERAGYS